MLNQEQIAQRRIIVKFYDDIDLPYEDDIGDYVEEAGIGPWKELAEQFPGIRLDRVFVTLTPNEILELVEQAQKIDLDYQAPNFLTYFAIDIPQEVDYQALVEVLSGWDTIEFAYVELTQAPGPDIDYTNDEFAGMQGHINLAPEGIGLRHFWDTMPGLPGLTGTGISFLDVEKGWKLDHEDFLDAGGASLVNEILPGHNREEFQHGTSTLGVVIAQNNAIGVIGIAPDALAHVLSIFRSAMELLPNREDAILTAGVHLGYGDVMLLEIQVEDSPGSDIRWPVEVERAVFDAIRLATALGIVVVQAAGTAGNAPSAQNIADYVVTELLPDGSMVDKNILNHVESNEFYQDSGAIMVSGANSNVVSGEHERLQESNYGNRVDCYAWGQNVVTTTTNNASVESGYYFNYGGSSSAAAIIAGAAIVVQSVQETSIPASPRFNSFQLREIFRDSMLNTGSPHLIGYMPNLVAILAALSTITDIYVRDNLADDGFAHTGPVSISPDIIVRPKEGPNSITNPDTELGTSTINDSNLGRIVINDKDHEVYVRVRNLNRSSDAENAIATVYWAPPSSLTTPDQWHLIGSSTPQTVPADPLQNSITVLNPIDWPQSDIPDAGHYCFIATIGSDDDPDPVGNPNLLNLYYDFDNFLNLIRLNNNVTWRNFNVVEIAAATAVSNPIPLPFIAPGAPDKDRKMQLEIGLRLPKNAQAWLEGPAEFMKRSAPTTYYLQNGEEKGTLKLPLNLNRINPLREMVFPAKSRHNLRILVYLPPDSRQQTHECFVRHLYKNEEVGRIKWRLEPPKTQQKPPVDRKPPQTRLQKEIANLNVKLSVLIGLVGALWLYMITKYNRK